MLHSRFDKIMTVKSAEAGALYESAINLILGSEMGAIECLDNALKLDPDFALALAVRYHLAKDANDPKATEYRERAEAAAKHANAWENAHIEALFNLLDDTFANLDKTQRYLQENGRDLLVISQLCGYLIFYGGEQKLSRVVQVLENADPSLKDDWAYLARLGFAISEAGDPDKGHTYVARAIELRPSAMYSLHSLAHILHDLGKPEESVQVIEEWLTNWGEKAEGGNLYGHIQWHLALAESQLGYHEQAWERYNQFCAPETTTCGPVLTLADCGGFLLRDFISHGKIREISDDVEALTERFTGMLSHPFIGLHVAGIHAASGNLNALRSCRESLEHMPTGVNRDMSLALVGAIENYSNNEFAKAVDALAGITPAQRVGVGGSYVERMLIDLIESRAAVLAA